MPAAPDPPVCGMTPSRARSASRSRSWDGSSPSARTLPLSAVRKPAQMSSVVVLPAPLRPSTAVMRPAGTVKVTPSRALRSPYRLLRFSTSSVGAGTRLSLGTRGHVERVTAMGVLTRAREGVHDAAHVIGSSRGFRVVARAGLVARAAFYLLLAGLAVDVAVTRGRGGRQANAHGALSVVAVDWWGLLAVLLTAVGFFVLGVARVAGALRDRELPSWRRTTTALQGAFYVALTWVPLSFVLGRRTTGSEQSQHAETARVLAWPGGRLLVMAVGLVVVVVCSWQIRTACTRDFTDGMGMSKRSPRVRRLITVVGVIGIVARALVFVPVGVFLVVAGAQANPRHADGLDATLAAVARRPWGPIGLGVVALGLVVFAAYSLLEARYRRVALGR